MKKTYFGSKEHHQHFKNTSKHTSCILQKTTTTTLGAPLVYNAFKTYTTFQLMLIDLGGR